MRFGSTANAAREQTLFRRARGGARSPRNICHARSCPSRTGPRQAPTPPCRPRSPPAGNRCAARAASATDRHGGARASAARPQSECHRLGQQEDHGQRDQSLPGQTVLQRVANPNSINQKLHSRGANRNCTSVPRNRTCTPKNRHGPSCAHSVRRVAHMHQPCDGIAFQPARALLDPRHDMAVRFLECHGRQQVGDIAMPRQTYAQIGVLGHVMRVPTAQALPARHGGRTASCRPAARPAPTAACPAG